MSAKHNAVEALSTVQAMAEESLDPETFGKWEHVRQVLKANRGDLSKVPETHVEGYGDNYGPDNLPPVEVQKCHWWNDEGEDEGTFTTACGRYFTLNEGNPTDNFMRYCYYCGKPVDYKVPEKSDEHHSQD